MLVDNGRLPCDWTKGGKGGKWGKVERGGDLLGGTVFLRHLFLCSIRFRSLVQV